MLKAGRSIVADCAGRIAQLGTPRAVYFQPAHAFVADFIGTLNRVGGLRVRPEDAELVAPQDAPHAGTVTACHFPGDHQRLQLRMDGGEGTVRKLAPRAAPQAGQRVGLRIHPNPLESLPC